MSFTAALRRLHRVVGITLAVFLASSAATGLLWAYAPFLYWEGGYLEKKTPVPSPRLDAVTLTVHDAMERARDALRADAIIAAVVLRADFGRLLYEVQYRTGGTAGSLLMDGTNGEILSPLGETNAEAIARQYVRGTPAVESIARLDDYVSRNGGGAVPVYHVTFQPRGEPEIFIHRDSGRIVEEQDRTRRVHFFVMKLHQLNFFGFKKTLTVIPGAALLALVASGAALWLVPELRRARRRRPASSASSSERAASEPLAGAGGLRT